MPTQRMTLSKSSLPRSRPKSKPLSSHQQLVIQITITSTETSSVLQTVTLTSLVSPMDLMVHSAPLRSRLFEGQRSRRIPLSSQYRLEILRTAPSSKLKIMLHAVILISLVSLMALMGQCAHLRSCLLEGQTSRRSPLHSQHQPVTRHTIPSGQMNITHQTVPLTSLVSLMGLTDQFARLHSRMSAIQKSKRWRMTVFIP